MPSLHCHVPSPGIRLHTERVPRVEWLREFGPEVTVALATCQVLRSPRVLVRWTALLQRISIILDGSVGQRGSRVIYEELRIITTKERRSNKTP